MWQEVVRTKARISCLATVLYMQRLSASADGDFRFHVHVARYFDIKSAPGITPPLGASVGTEARSLRTSTSRKTCGGRPRSAGCQGERTG